MLTNAVEPTQSGVSEAEIDDILARCANLGVVSSRKFARWLVQELKRKPLFKVPCSIWEPVGQGA